MQAEFVVVTLRSDEKVNNGPAEMLSKLDQIINLNWDCKFCILREIIVNIFRASGAAQPSWEVACVSDQKVAGQRSESVVKHWKGPFDQGVASFFPSFWVGVGRMIDVVFLTNTVE